MMILKWILIVGVVVEKSIKIPSSGYLRYDWFKQKFNSNNYIHKILEALSNNIEGSLNQV